jgi:site-specific DNA-methyltransferase (adenine-specific)
MGDIQLFNMDCFEFFKDYVKKIKEMDPLRRCCLYVLDLPYGITSCEWDKEINLDLMWEYLMKISHPNSYFIFFGTAGFGTKLINSKPNYFRYDLIWKKKNSVGFLNSNRAPLRIHENIYVFGKTSSNDTKREYNKELREYSRKLFKDIGVNSGILMRKYKTKAYSHFVGYKAQQFSLCSKDRYEKLVQDYNIDKLDYFMTYDEMLKKYTSLPCIAKYNPQKTKGHKKYKHRGGYITGGVYGVFEKAKNTNDGTRFPTSILEFKYDKEKLHPTQKPVALLEWLIKTYSNKNDLVMDFTMGSGSAGVACKKLNRRFIGVEMNKEYFNIAKKRIDEYNL